MSSILCIDVGGSRIKAAVLPERVDVDGMDRTPRIALRTLGWLNQCLPDIISHENWASVVRHKELPTSYDEIAVCVPGPVINGRFLRTDIDVPADLLLKLREQTDKPVHLYKDADAWAAGAVAYSSLRQEPLSFPAIALVFGTGVGFSVDCDEARILSVEIGQWPGRFSALTEEAGQPVDPAWKVHSIVGKRFFEWVETDKQHWSYQRIREEFSKRVAALVADTVDPIGERTGPVKSVIVGGGNAEFVSVRRLEEKCGLEVTSLWSRRINLDPDFIPLLGLHRLAAEQRTPIEMF